MGEKYLVTAEGERLKFEDIESAVRYKYGKCARARLEFLEMVYEIAEDHINVGATDDFDKVFFRDYVIGNKTREKFAEEQGWLKKARLKKARTKLQFEDFQVEDPSEDEDFEDEDFVFVVRLRDETEGYLLAFREDGTVHRFSDIDPDGLEIKLTSDGKVQFT